MATPLTRSLGVASALGRLHPDGKLGIPVEVRRATSWLQAEKHISLIAELVEPGRVHLYPHAALLPRIEAARRRIEAGADSGEALAALSDRWRPVVYYPSNESARLGDVIAVFLRPGTDETEQVFLEAREAFVCVMSLATRNTRLSRYASQTELADNEDG